MTNGPRKFKPRKLLTIGANVKACSAQTLLTFVLMSTKTSREPRWAGEVVGVGVAASPAPRDSCENRTVLQRTATALAVEESVFAANDSLSLAAEITVLHENCVVLQDELDEVRERLESMEKIVHDSKFRSYQDEAAWHAATKPKVFHTDIAYYVLIVAGKGIYPQTNTEWLGDTSCKALGFTSKEAMRACSGKALKVDTISRLCSDISTTWRGDSLVNPNLMDAFLQAYGAMAPLSSLTGECLADERVDVFHSALRSITGVEGCPGFSYVPEPHHNEKAITVPALKKCKPGAPFWQDLQWAVSRKQAGHVPRGMDKHESMSAKRADKHGKRPSEGEVVTVVGVRPSVSPPIKRRIRGPLFRSQQPEASAMDQAAAVDPAVYPSLDYEDS